MVETINIEEIKQKLIDKLEPSGWTTKLRGFIKSSDFEKIIQTLYDQRQQGKRFTPPLKTVFTAFEKCPVKDLRVVLIGQDPYPYINVADGMAFSCSLTDKPQTSLKFIQHAITQTVYDNDETKEHNPDLSRWAEQGVLLLNSALTCEIDKIGSHYPIWKDFVAYLMDMLNFTDSGLVFILLGKQAQELESLIGQNHYILKASHPASAAHNGTNMWDCNDVFNESNRIIEKNVGKEFIINW